MTEQPPAKKKCLGADCENDAGTLQCPKCLSLGIKGSFFCSQDCFKKNWVRRILLDIFVPYVLVLRLGPVPCLDWDLHANLDS